ncbi:MAG TPA: acylphosphatase [Euryarchaeota archaeon]|nr:MAG: acylphosphatase [Thermococci archaeon]HEC95565.1 acylphosphatase [Euryarchaeota archaeon]
MKQVHIFVSGRVQGVFYRANTRKKAKELGIKGWVRNLYDGRVEITAEGKEEDLKKFIEWCKKGPELAFVENIKVEWKDYKGNYKDFSVVR